MTPPFIPILESETDTRNFDPEFTGCQVKSYEESPTKESDKFKGFSYGKEEN